MMISADLEKIFFDICFDNSQSELHALLINIENEEIFQYLIDSNFIVTAHKIAKNTFEDNIDIPDYLNSKHYFTVSENPIDVFKEESHCDYDVIYIHPFKNDYQNFLMLSLASSLMKKGNKLITKFYSSNLQSSKEFRALFGKLPTMYSNFAVFEK